MSNTAKQYIVTFSATSRTADPMQGDIELPFSQFGSTFLPVEHICTTKKMKAIIRNTDGTIFALCSSYGNTSTITPGTRWPWRRRF